MSDRKPSFKKGNKPNRGNKAKTSAGSNAQQKAVAKKKKSIDDYFFYVGSSKQASDYEVTVEYIINYIKLTFPRGTDISESLRNMEPADTDQWMPKMKRSTASDDNVKAQENEEYKMLHSKQLDNYCK